MIVYWLLMPLTLLDGIAMSYFSLQSSLNQGWFYFCALALVNIIPLWAFISKYSKNLIFDGLLFVVILTGSELVTISLLDQNQRTGFSLLNWFGLLIAFIGFVLMKTDWTKNSKQEA